MILGATLETDLWEDYVMLMTYNIIPYCVRSAEMDGICEEFKNGYSVTFNSGKHYARV